jgi:hypothetical protein
MIVNHQTDASDGLVILFAGGERLDTRKSGRKAYDDHSGRGSADHVGATAGGRGLGQIESPQPDSPCQS